MGLMLALAARAGALPGLSCRVLVRPVLLVLAISACCALVAGFVGYHAGGFVLDFLQPQPRQPMRTVAVLFAHNASYGASFVGGVALCVWAFVKRWEMAAARASSLK